MGLIASIFDDDGNVLANASADSDGNRDVFIAVARLMERFRMSYPSKILVKEIEKGCILQVRSEQ